MGKEKTCECGYTTKAEVAWKRHLRSFKGKPGHGPAGASLKTKPKSKVVDEPPKKPARKLPPPESEQLLPGNATDTELSGTTSCTTCQRA